MFAVAHMISETTERRRWAGRLLCALALTACAAPRAPAACPAPRPEPLRVAVTIDDLPGNELPTPEWPKSRIMQQLVQALRAQGVAAPVGFVNGSYMEGDADAARGLASWLGAGFEVGNHGYAHASADRLSVDAFLADIAQNEALLPPRRGPQRYFRYPYLERGRTPEERARIRAWLHAHGYRIADVSIDFVDWAFTPAYARCAGDQAALEALDQAYLEKARAALHWAHETAQRLFGRAAPQVLLLHACTPTARNLGALLQAYASAGVRSISLHEALADPLYAEDPARDRGDTDALAEAIQRQHAPIASFVPRALPLLQLACHAPGS
jgi:peptidoglycan/xylan/chitin deacetylase (PgdA/CDA1 family)